MIGVLTAYLGGAIAVLFLATRIRSEEHVSLWHILIAAFAWLLGATMWAFKSWRRD